MLTFLIFKILPQDLGSRDPNILWTLPPCHPMSAFDQPPPTPCLDDIIYEQPLIHRDVMAVKCLNIIR